MNKTLLTYEIYSASLKNPSTNNNMEKEKDFTLEELQDIFKVINNLSKRCREQFKRNLRDYLKEHPELKDGKVRFNPDNTFQVERDLKHGCDIVCDVVAAGIDDEGKVVLDLEGENYTEKEVHLHGEVCYGAYVEDWAYALEILLKTMADPYIPWDEEEEEEKEEEE